MEKDYKFKVGDEVYALVKGKIIDMGTDCDNYPCYAISSRYFKAINDSHLFNEDCVISVEDKDKTYDQGIEDGMNKAWELVNKILEMDSRTLTGIFGTDYLTGNECSIGLFYIFKKYSPKEILEKIETYEENKTLEVGDIVEIEQPNSKNLLCVVTYFNKNANEIITLCSTGVSYWNQISPRIKKTGRHIDIETILSFIGETDPNKLLQYTVIERQVDGSD